MDTTEALIVIVLGVIEVGVYLATLIMFVPAGWIVTNLMLMLVFTVVNQTFKSNR